MADITLNYTTPGSYNFQVPNGITKVTATAIGGGGDGGYSGGGSGTGGAGGGFGRSVDISVSPGEIYTVYVGNASQSSYIVRQDLTYYLAIGAGGPAASPFSGSSGSYGTTNIVEGSAGEFGSGSQFGRGGRAGNLVSMSPTYRPLGSSDRGGYGTFVDGNVNTETSYIRNVIFQSISGALYIPLYDPIFAVGSFYVQVGDDGVTDYSVYVGYTLSGILSGAGLPISGTITSVVYNFGGGGSDGSGGGTITPPSWYIYTDGNPPIYATDYANITISGNLAVGGVYFGGGGAGNIFGSNSAGSGYPGAARIEYNYPQPTITSFTASPNPQTSSLGTPLYTTTLNWTIGNGSGSYNYLINPGNYTGTTGNTGQLSITDLPQSVAGVISPNSRTYTLTITETFGSNQDSANVTVNVYNDNNPDTITIPLQTITGRPLDNLQPNTTYIVDFGQIPGIDMPTIVQNFPGETIQFSNDANLWSFNLLLNPVDNLYIRFTSLPFNTDPNGITNTRTISFLVGTDTVTFDAITRAPNVNEIFDFEGPIDSLPNPDVDTLPLPLTQPYISTGIDAIVNDAEIPVEIKVSDPNAQVQINGGSWSDMRQI